MAFEFFFQISGGFLFTRISREMNEIALDAVIMI